ncbi:MAG: DUF1552 domain-containing protein [Lentisphaeraceae bacterium]|nr:DUF1552 domain-containing protein [Lentisphaeraceae bacterium]
MKNLSRRTVLKGLSGLTVSLPWLEAVAENKKTQTPKIPRTAFLFAPNGVNPHHWDPEYKNGELKLSKILSPLENIKTEVDSFKNLYHQGAVQPGGHFPKTANFLCGVHINRTTGKDIKCGLSADQIIAKKYGHLTPLPSIELGIEPTRTGISVATGYTMVYGGHISWSSPTTPMPKEIYPELAFDRLFNSSSMNKGITSVLDDIKEDRKSLLNYLGAEDRSRMEAYFTSVRSLEQRVEDAKKRNKEKPVKVPVEKRPPEGIPENLDEHITLMLDLIVLAFQMNRTNVATFMFGNSVSGKNFSFIEGVEGGFHELSHHTNNKEKLEMYAKVNQYIISQYGRMITSMRDIKEGDQTLLDNSLVMFGSGLRDGNKHSPYDLPILLAGKGGRKDIKRGQHRVYEKKTPLCNLLLGMVQNSGIEISKFNFAKNAII